MNERMKQPTHQSINKPTNQPTNQSTNQPTYLATKQTNKEDTLLQDRLGMNLMKLSSDGLDQITGIRF
jgi:hypothetical protein